MRSDGPSQTCGRSWTQLFDVDEQAGTFTLQGHTLASSQRHGDNRLHTYTGRFLPSPTPAESAKGDTAEIKARIKLLPVLNSIQWQVFDAVNPPVV